MSEKVPNQSVLEQPVQGLRTSLITVFPVCFFDKDFVNFIPDTGMRKFRIDQGFLIEHWHTMYNVNVILLKFSLNIVKLNSINLLLFSGILCFQTFNM